MARVRRLAGIRKVGHAGTLDPMATGVLVVGINRGTRLLGYLTLTDKAYIATIRLGISTVSDDAEGEVTEAVGARPETITDAALQPCLEALRGEVWQVPSAVSAIKVGGVRSYARVRAGQEVQLAARSVRVDQLEVLEREDRQVDGVPVVDLAVAVACSSGTYVRALARDLGAALGVGGHLTQLRRTRVGPFTLAESQSLNTALPGTEPQLELIGLDKVAGRCFPTWRADRVQADAVRHGRRLPGVSLSASPTAVMDEAGQFLALYRQQGADAAAEAVFASPAPA